MRTRAVIAATVLVIGLAAQGCVYIPSFSDFDDAINRIDAIEEGVTTKAEVLQEFGEPTVEYPEMNGIKYRGTLSHGTLVLVATGPYGAYGIPLGEESWWFTVVFDENDVVLTATTNDTMNDADDFTRLRTAAVRGDAFATKALDHWTQWIDRSLCHEAMKTKEEAGLQFELKQACMSK